MGYRTNMTGEMHIEPPLRWSEYRDSTSRNHEIARQNDKAFSFVETADSMDTDDGPLQVRRAAMIEPTYDEAVKLYKVVEELQEIVNAYHPGHEFVGEFRGQGEDANDMWKLRVIDGKVQRLVPTITWPDGSTERCGRHT